MDYERQKIKQLVRWTPHDYSCKAFLSQFSLNSKNNLWTYVGSIDIINTIFQMNRLGLKNVEVAVRLKLGV